MRLGEEKEEEDEDDKGVRRNWGEREKKKWEEEGER